MKKGHEFYKDDEFPDIGVASMTECTGLIPSLIEDDIQGEAYLDLQTINKQKPST